MEEIFKDSNNWINRVSSIIKFKNKQNAIYKLSLKHKNKRGKKNSLYLIRTNNKRFIFSFAAFIFNNTLKKIYKE
jgi:hypothetical protein